MSNVWNKPNVPRRGWQCVDVIDVRRDEGTSNGDGYEACQMCGNYPIRFVHVMGHANYGEEMRVGCVCAEHMSNDYANPKIREARLSKKATRKRNWLSLKWRTSAKGNPYLRKDGMLLTVFPNKRKPGFWNYVIDGDFGHGSYPSQESAQLALFEEYWGRLDS